MTFRRELQQRVGRRLKSLYGDEEGQRCLQRVLALAAEVAPHLANGRPKGSSERDVVLITYADQLRRQDTPPLRVLAEFLESTGLSELINTIHLLPFFPYSSDDGFSITDFKQVDPSLGRWSDIRYLGQKYSLMFDLVCNHVSSKSDWFREFLSGQEPYTEFFLEVDPDQDLSMVARPRSSPLLTRVETSRGPRFVWTTFSADQIDLNYASPTVLFAMLDVLFFYVEQGARIIRLDAIAYLWKQIGTPCIHLCETHTIVKLMRDLLDVLAPGTLLLTETNVPHSENISYFGSGDEAHMIYQFSLAPLLLEALLSGDARLLSDWARSVCQTPEGTTFFNFTASHDGIGVRPLQGLVPAERFDRLIDSISRRGGHVSMKSEPDGTQSPYELNITYFDALGASDLSPELHVRRFLTSQSIMLALRGVPGIYFHSLTATPNNHMGSNQSGRARTINRRKFTWQELFGLLWTPESIPAIVFGGYRRMIFTRISHRAFHPEAPQEILDLSNRSLFGFRRTSLDGEEEIMVLANVSSTAQTVDAARLLGRPIAKDLLSDERIRFSTSTFDLEPFETVWLLAE